MGKDQAEEKGSLVNKEAEAVSPSKVHNHIFLVILY